MAENPMSEEERLAGYGMPCMAHHSMGFRRAVKGCEECRPPRLPATPESEVLRLREAFIAGALTGLVPGMTVQDHNAYIERNADAYLAALAGHESTEPPRPEPLDEWSESHGHPGSWPGRDCASCDEIYGPEDEAVAEPPREDTER